MKVTRGYQGRRFVMINPFEKIQLYQLDHINQRKKSLLLNLILVPPPPKTKKLFIFFQRFIYSLLETLSNIIDGIYQSISKVFTNLYKLYILIN